MVYFTDDSLLPENQVPMIITAAPYAPAWLPGDAPDIAVSWDQQVQAAVDCFNAGATHLHVHVRDPKTGHGSVDFDEFNYMLGRLRKAVPKMILSVGGSISFAPKSDEAKAQWLSYDTRHMLAELTPKPDQVTIAIGTGMMDVIQMFTPDDVQGTHLSDPKAALAYTGLWADAGPGFYIEHLKRLRAHGVQPYFMLGYVHQLEIVERLIRAGVYMGPLNHCLVAVGGGCAGHNPFDMMEYVRRAPHGSVFSMMSTMRSVIPLCTMAIALGLHVRVGNEDNLWASSATRKRITTVQQVEQMVRIAKELGRRIATPEEAREIMKIGTWYSSPDETLANLGLPPNRKGGQMGFIVKQTDGLLKTTRGLVASDSHPIVGPIPAE